MRPVFRGGELYCYLASAAHWHDVGGAVPGNYNPAATECWQEAVQIPPVRMVRGGELDEDVLAILKANSRLPDSLWGDLNGQLAALELGAGRLDDLLQEYGDDTVRAALDTLRQRARRLMLDHVASLPDGEYRYRDTLDNDGVKDAELTIALRCARAVNGWNWIFGDLAGLRRSGQYLARHRRGRLLRGAQARVPGCAGQCRRAGRGDGDAARRPLDLGGTAAPRGRLYRDHPAHDRRDLLRRGQAAPERARPRPTAPSTRCPSPATAATRRARQRWVMFSFFGGGHGGHSAGDGLSHGNAPISTATIPPLEILEAAYPVRFTQWALRPDSAGDGRHRGGLGAIYEIELLEDSAEAFIFGERGRSRGVAGGEPAASNVFRYQQDGQWLAPPMTSRCWASRSSAANACGWKRRAAAATDRRRSAAARRRDRDMGYVSGADAARKREGHDDGDDATIPGGGRGRGRHVHGPVRAR